VFSSKHQKLFLMKTPISRLRTVGIYEGISFLVLLGIGMPLKYMAGIPEVVKYVGWAHGVLFILYIMAVLQVALVHRWSVLKVAMAVIASLLPFGPFVLDKKLLRSEEQGTDSPKQKQTV
jgi:integral membrane protein